MKYETKISKDGIIELPQELIDKFKLSIGDELEVSISEAGCILLSPVKKESTKK